MVEVVTKSRSAKKTYLLNFFKIFATLSKKKLRLSFFPVNFAKVFGTVFYSTTANGFASLNR